MRKIWLTDAIFAAEPSCRKKSSGDRFTFARYCAEAFLQNIPSERDLRLFSAESLEKILIFATVYFLEFDEHADADIQLAGFVFGIATAGDIAAAELEYSAELFLRDIVAVAKRTQIIAYSSVSS